MPQSYNRIDVGSSSREDSKFGKILEFVLIFRAYFFFLDLPLPARPHLKPQVAHAASTASESLRHSNFIGGSVPPHTHIHCYGRAE